MDRNWNKEPNFIYNPQTREWKVIYIQNKANYKWKSTSQYKTIRPNKIKRNYK